MQQALSGRVSEFRDQVEDWLQDLARYASQILLLELTPAQVEFHAGWKGVIAKAFTAEDALAAIGAV